MSSSVNWFVLAEEHSIGSAKINGKDIFITEESVRFEAPLVKIHETLREAVMQICSLDEEDLEYDEEREYFEETLKKAQEAYKS